MMVKKLLTVVTLATAGGVVLGFGCACGSPCSWFSPCKILPAAIAYFGMEFLTDNDAVFDLFQDDFGTGALYDDRFTAAPTRAEP